MAAVNWRLAVQVTDANKAPAALDVNLHTTSGLLADMESFTSAYLGVLDPVTASQLTKAEIVVPQIISGAKTSPVASTNNSVGALLDYATANPLENASQWVANWIAAGFEAAHENLVDQAQTEVAAYLAFLLATTNTTTVVDGDGNALTALRRAVKTTRKFRRALGRAR